MPVTEVLPTAELPDTTVHGIRRLMDLAFGQEFTEADWAHALGGWHVVVRAGASVVAHAAVVPRRLEVGGQPFDAGYVEAVATAPTSQGQGLGSSTMTELGAVLRREFQIGALSTDRHHFYERLGWERWQGPSYVRRAGVTVRTADEDEGIMVLRFGGSRDVASTAPIVCEARPGDDW